MLRCMLVLFVLVASDFKTQSETDKSVPRVFCHRAAARSRPAPAHVHSPPHAAGPVTRASHTSRNSHAPVSHSLDRE
jgi:hypothetical protein